VGSRSSAPTSVATSTTRLAPPCLFGLSLEAARKDKPGSQPRRTTFASRLPSAWTAPTARQRRVRRARDGVTGSPGWTMCATTWTVHRSMTSAARSGGCAASVTVGDRGSGGGCGEAWPAPAHHRPDFDQRGRSVWPSSRIWTSGRTSRSAGAVLQMNVSTPRSPTFLKGFGMWPPKDASQWMRANGLVRAAFAPARIVVQVGYPRRSCAFNSKRSRVLRRKDGYTSSRTKRSSSILQMISISSRSKALRIRYTSCASSADRSVARAPDRWVGRWRGDCRSRHHPR
jgi:hypothetical protein